MRCVLDTNVVVAGMRSPSGASAALLMAARHGEITMLANVALALEYEATCRRAEHIVAAGLKPAQVTIFIDAVIAMGSGAGSVFDPAPAMRNSAL